MTLIVATFRHSAYLELAIQLIEQKGISKDALLAAPLEKRPRDGLSEMKAVHRDGKSPYDLAFILAMVFMLLGAIYGFVLPWGPVIWSMIGIVFGATAGLLLEALLGKKPFAKRDVGSEVVLMIACDVQQTNIVETILWEHRALGVSKIADSKESVQ